MKAGWETIQLGAVCRLLNGRAYKKSELLADGKYPVLRVGNFFSNRSWYYSDLELDDAKYCDDGDLLYAWSASFGPRIWQGGKVIYHYHIWKTALDEMRIDKRFLFYWFDWDAEKIQSEQGAGTTMIHVTKGAMEKRFLSLPPLPEQKRIVAILDKVFAAIDAAAANAQTNLDNARELFESYLNTVFTENGAGWVDKTLGEIANFKNGLNFTRSSRGEKLKIVGVKDFGSNYWVPWEKLDTVQIDGLLSDAYFLQRDDILTVRSNGNKQLIGRCILAGEVSEKTSHSGFTIRVRISSIEVDPRFLVHFLKSKTAHKMLVNSGDGANITSLNQKALSCLPVRYPSRVEQSRIVTEIEIMMTTIQHLQAIYESKLKALTELKQSVLQKAFAGELTADDAIDYVEAVA